MLGLNLLATGGKASLAQGATGPHTAVQLQRHYEGHTAGLHCFRDRSLYIMLTSSPLNDPISLQAQPDRHAEELVHLQQQCSDLRQHLRDSAEESGRQAKSVKALEANLRQSLAAQGDRDSENAQLKEAAAARSNLDSSAAQVLFAQDPPAHARAFSVMCGH